MKQILYDDFSQQRNKEKSLSLLPLDINWVIWHGKIWGCVYQEVFKKQLLIIKV